MGDHNVHLAKDNDERGKFIKHLIKDIDALEHLYKNGLIEKGPIRIGAEQEFCLVNEQWRPAKNAVDILEKINDPHFTTELAAFNLEINLDPFVLKGKAFTEMATQLRDLLVKAEKIADEHGSKIVLTGILPSISEEEINLDYMTPNRRYYALNDKLRELRGGDFRMLLCGVDELSIFHDTVMYEACNTSFQMHLQIDPDDMISSFNWSQAIAGPVLGICVNSPLLQGRELWSETRIALFQQSIDTRKVSNFLHDKEARVSFGEEWAKGDLVDLFKNEIIRHSIILTKEIEEDSMEKIQNGDIPKLAAMNLHNGTVYRWNRPCYGTAKGTAHVRIENRYIPSGPSVDSEMANFAFWVGIMKARPKEFDDMAAVMDFKDAKANFMKAARYGASSMMSWKGKQHPLRDLLKDVFLPLAKEGLKKIEIDQSEIDHYLGIIERRIEGQTPSEWMIQQYRELQSKMKKDDALIALTQTIHHHQRAGKVLEKWPKSLMEKNFPSSASMLGHIMSTSLVSLSPRDNAELSLRLMKWRNIHRIPIIDEENRLVGLLTMRHLRQYWDQLENSEDTLLVEDIMIKNVQTATTTTNIRDAIQLMKKEEIGCLPIVKNEELVGIATIQDLLKFDEDGGEA